MDALVIPENFRDDQYILKPLLFGVGETQKSRRIPVIVDGNDGMTDIFIVCVDRDGNRKRRQRLDHFQNEFGSNCIFLVENAWEEIENWILAG